MGIALTISHDKFPKQGTYLNREVNVCFNYDTSYVVSGIIVRDDIEEPFRGIIKLDDGRYILTTECQYQPK